MVPVLRLAAFERTDAQAEMRGNVEQKQCSKEFQTVNTLTICLPKISFLLQLTREDRLAAETRTSEDAEQMLDRECRSS